ncbi:MAG TPA: AraC family transcriptional regulator [Lysobacter sp.]|nr:AraC family transcriptional regulator [Lysobacter sp.]
MTLRYGDGPRPDNARVGQQFMTILSVQDAKLTVHASQYAPNHIMPAHADQRSRLSIVVAGRVLESVGRHDEYATAGSLAIKPGHVVHQNRFGPEGARMLSIELPDWLITGQPAAIVDQWRWFHGGPLTVLATRLWLAARQPSDNHTGLADRLIDAIAAAGELGSPGVRGSPPGWLRQIQQQLHDDYAEGSSLFALAAGAGVHPVYLARLFRRYFRCSVTDYVQALRLSAAVERMAVTPEALATIAAATGYADQSHLSRACQRGLGLAPRRCRLLLAAADARG